MGNTICPLGDAAVMPVLGFLEKYREELRRTRSWAAKPA